MQRSGTEVIRTKIKASKPRLEIFNIANSQNYKRELTRVRTRDEYVKQKNVYSFNKRTNLIFIFTLWNLLKKKMHSKYIKLLFLNAQNEDKSAWTNSLIIRTYVSLNSTDVWFINLREFSETFTTVIFSKYVIHFKQIGL